MLLSAYSAPVSAQEVKLGFDQIYEAAGKPRVIVLMSDDFATLINDWSLERHLPDPQLNTRPNPSPNTLLAEEVLFSGFTRLPPLTPTQPKGIGVFHTQLIAHLTAASIRIADHQTTLGASENMDHQEMIHIGRHADILAELIFMRDPSEASGFAVQIRAMRAADGRYLGSRRIAAPSRSTPERLGWRTGEAIISLLRLTLQH